MELVDAKSRFMSWWPILVVFLVTLGSGLRGIGNQDLWYDELETAYAVSTRLTGAVDPPTIPYYFILQVLTLNGNLVTDLTLRVPSAIAMALAASLVAAAAWQVTKGQVASLVSGTLVALAPGALRLAQEARPYAFAALGSALALSILTSLLKDESRKKWVALSLTVLVTTVLAPITLALVPVLLVLVFQVSRPLVPRFLAYFSWVVPVVALAAIASARFSDLRSWLSPPTLIGLRDAPIWISTSDTFGLFGTTAFGLALLVLTVVTRQGSRVLLALLMGIGALWLVSLGPTSLWTGRTFIIFLPFLAFGAGLAFRDASWVRGLAALLLLAVFVQPAHAYLREPGNRGPSWSAVVANITPMIQVGDSTNDRVLFLAVHHYGSTTTLPLTTSQLEDGVWSSSPPPCGSEPTSRGVANTNYFVCRGTTNG